MDKIKTEFARRHFAAEVILWAVRWYLQFPISEREQINEEGGGAVALRAFAASHISQKHCRAISLTDQAHGPPWSRLQVDEDGATHRCRLRDLCDNPQGAGGVDSGQRHGITAHHDSVLIRDRGLISATRQGNAPLPRVCNKTKRVPGAISVQPGVDSAP